MSPVTKKMLDEAVDEIAIVTNNAIQYEVGKLREEMNERFERLESSQERLESSQKRFESSQERLESSQKRFESNQERFESSQSHILDVLRSIDEQLREHKDLPARMARVERMLFR